MTATGIVCGKRLRLTRVAACGLPIKGENSSLTTKGFVTINITKVMKDAEDLEQTNADGGVCIADRTPPELKWLEFEAEFCRVDPEVLSFFTDDATVLDYANRPVGFRSSKTVKVDAGAAVELWTGVGSDDCDLPEDDSAFDVGETGNAPYGYFVLPFIKEAVMGDFEIGAQVTTFKVSGITGAAPKWGRGPYNVVPVDAKNTAGRLLTPFEADQHLHFQRTTIAPPPETDGAVELTLPSPYFGATAADIVTEPGAAGGDPVGGSVTLAGLTTLPGEGTIPQG